MISGSFEPKDIAFYMQNNYIHEVQDSSTIDPVIFPLENISENTQREANRKKILNAFFRKKNEKDIQDQTRYESFFKLAPEDTNVFNSLYELYKKHASVHKHYSSESEIDSIGELFRKLPL